MTNKEIFERTNGLAKTFYTIQEFSRINPDMFWQKSSRVTRLIEPYNDYILVRYSNRIELWRPAEYGTYTNDPVRTVMLNSGPKLLGRLLEAYLNDIEQRGNTK